MRIIFLQCSEKALQRHGIMCVIDHQCEFVRYLDHLNTAFDPGHLQSFDDILLGYLKMVADGNGSQRIVNAELTWNIDLHRKIHKSLNMIGNSQIPLSSNESGALCTEICFFGKSIGFQITSMSLNYFLKMLIVAVYDTNLTLSEKHGFAVQIIIKVLVLIRSDMIWFNICENSKIKHKSLGSVKHQSL